MSKKEKLESLATFIGLKAAHEIIAKLTNKPESIPHLERESDAYGKLSSKLAIGNWNIEDISKIKELAKKRCVKKLDAYKDIDDRKYEEADSVIKSILLDLELNN